MIFDKRITPIRNDIAASEYKGFLKNRKFVRGKIYFVKSNFSNLLSNNKKQLISQLLYGESVKVFEIKKGYAWLQSLRDDYVGYTSVNNLQAKKLFLHIKLPPFVVWFINYQALNQYQLLSLALIHK